MKKFLRSKTDRKIAGVCGGLADYTGIDSTVWRIGFVLIAIPGGVPGVLIYGAMWLIVPEQDTV